MVVYYGTRLFGKVDQIDDTGIHVATKFFHIWFVPLVPLGTSLVVETTDDGWSGVPLPISVKSILVAYGRAACFFGVVTGIVACFESAIAGAASIVLSIALFVASYWIFVARGSRREQLLAMVKPTRKPSASAMAPTASASSPSVSPAPVQVRPPTLIGPEVDRALIGHCLRSLGFADVQAPHGTLARFARADGAVTITEGPIGIVALHFEGAGVVVQPQVAAQLPAFGVDQVRWLLQSPQPAHAHAGLWAASALQLTDLRPHVERYSAHPDPHVRAEAQRALSSLAA